MPSYLGLISVLVDNYETALDFYVGILDFELLEDTPRGNSRWVVVRPKGAKETALLLRKATEEQHHLIGKQGAGKVWLFLNTSDFEKDYQRLRQAGVNFLEAPRDETYAKVVVFEDCYGNRFDLLQRKTP